MPHALLSLMRDTFIYRYIYVYSYQIDRQKYIYTIVLIHISFITDEVEHILYVRYYFCFLSKLPIRILLPVFLHFILFSLFSVFRDIFYIKTFPVFIRLGYFPSLSLVCLFILNVILFCFQLIRLT